MKHFVLLLAFWYQTTSAQDWSWLSREISIELEGDFYTPVQLDFDRHGNMYICDSKAARIFKIAPDGRLLFSFGHKGEGPLRGDLTSNFLWENVAIVVQE